MAHVAAGGRGLVTSLLLLLLPACLSRSLTRPRPPPVRRPRSEPAVSDEVDPHDVDRLRQAWEPLE